MIPNNYVNNSGRTLYKIIKSSNLKPEDCLILHDELDLDIGSLRLKYAGGHGGHNGLKDISNKIDSLKSFNQNFGNRSVNTQLSNSQLFAKLQNDGNKNTLIPGVNKQLAEFILIILKLSDLLLEIVILNFNFFIFIITLIRFYF